MNSSLLSTRQSQARITASGKRKRYKKNFDKRVRRTNVNIGPGDYVFIDPNDGRKKKGKL